MKESENRSLTNKRSPNRLLASINRDSSLHKAQLVQTRIKILENSVQEKKQKIDGQQKKFLQAWLQSQKQQYWETCVIAQLKLYNQLAIQKQKAAVCIQRHVRGYISRGKSAYFFNEKERECMKKEVDGLVDHTKKCFVNIGNMVIPATVVIQQHYKRYLIKKKLDLLARGYKHHLWMKKQAASANVKNMLRSYICIDIVKQLKFQKYKKQRLFEIKRRIAVLTVKKMWRKNKLSFRIIKERLIKIKRRRLALQQKEQMQKMMSTSMGKSSKRASSPSPAAPLSPGKAQTENMDLIGSDSDASIIIGMSPQQIQQFKRNKYEKIRKQQEVLALSKIAYSVQQPKQKYTFPIMQQQALDEQSEPASYLNSTRAKLDKISSVWQKEKNGIRNTMIGSPRQIFTRGGFRADLPPLKILDRSEIPVRPRTKASYRAVSNQHFLETTVAHNNRVHEPQFDFSPPKPVISRNSKYKPKILHNTISVSLKIQDRFQPSTLKPWKTPLRRKVQYVPSLDNQWYTPVRLPKTAYSPDRALFFPPRISTSPVCSDYYKPSYRSGTSNSPTTQVGSGDLSSIG